MPKPNFTGTWEFNRQKSVLQVPSPDRSIFVVEHREPLFRINRTHVAGGKRDAFMLDLTTDGRESVMERDGSKLVARAYWDGDTLVFDTRIVRGGEEATNVVRYTLAPGGGEFVAHERFRSASVNYDNMWLLERT